MFGALVKGMTSFRSSDLEISMEDIDVLNSHAASHLPDITKLSFAAYPFVSGEYQILNSGSALGYKNGPLLVSRRKIYPDEIWELHIAVPGERTTANLLLETFYPKVKQKTYCLFSDIEDMVMDNACDAGLLIHENRFTYEKKGLRKIADLGEMWEKEFDSPIPLGCIVVKRSLPYERKKEFEKALSESIKTAFADQQPIWAFIKENARELEDEVIQAHIDLYVNDFSISLGEKGRKAIQIFFKKGEERGLLPPVPEDIFVD